MAQWVKRLALRLDNLILVPRPHMKVEGESWLHRIVIWPLHICCGIFVPNNNINNKYMWWWYSNSYNNLGVPKVWCYQTRRLISTEHTGTSKEAKASQVPKSKQSKPVLLLWRNYFIFLNPLIVFCLILSLFTTVWPNHFVLHINTGVCSN